MICTDTVVSSFEHQRVLSAVLTVVCFTSLLGLLAVVAAAAAAVESCLLSCCTAEECSSLGMFWAEIASVSVSFCTLALTCLDFP